MKLKHLIGWVLYFAIIGYIFTLMGCTSTDLDRRIIAWQRTHPDREGDCMIFAMKRQAYHIRKGRRAKICHGFFKGEDHAWCEYQSGIVWLVDDAAQGLKGYPREVYTTNGKPDYELSWDGE